jgi:hypothetical protein
MGCSCYEGPLVDMVEGRILLLFGVRGYRCPDIALDVGGGVRVVVQPLEGGCSPLEWV